MTYRVLTNSRRIEKDFLLIITGFREDEQNTIWQILRLTHKGSGETHWTIKKVYRDIWQLDLPHGYRLEYTVGRYRPRGTRPLYWESRRCRRIFAREKVTSPPVSETHQLCKTETMICEMGF